MKQDIYKIAQSIINKRLGIVKTTAKNTFKTACVLLALSSCEKAESIIPSLPQDNKYKIHIYTDCSIVDLYINGRVYTVGTTDMQFVDVIQVDTIKSLFAIRVYGRKSSMSVYHNNTVKHYGDF